MPSVFARFFRSLFVSRVLPLALICVLVTFNRASTIESSCRVDYRQERASGLFYIDPEPACFIEWLGMTTPEEREQRFARRMDAMNFYLRVLSRARGYDIVLLPEPKE